MTKKHFLAAICGIGLPVIMLWKFNLHWVSKIAVVGMIVLTAGGVIVELILDIAQNRK